MTEEFLHYVWQYGLYDSKDLKTSCGKTVRIMSSGYYNHDAGPDFLEAKIYIDNVLWIGHVEIHIEAKNWDQHKHNLDPAYNAVILHVVNKMNKEVHTSSGVKLPTLSIKIKEEYYKRYHKLMSELSPIPCGKTWQDYSPVKIENAVVNMGVERMEKRAASLERNLSENRGDKKDLFFQLICRSFGFGKNQLPMELLGKSIRSLYVEKHYANLFQLESMFFGQSGFIPASSSDSYVNALRTEHSYLKRKYNFNLPAGLRWKFLRMRPGNFPTVRIAQLCSFFHQKPDIIDHCLDVAGSGYIDNIDINTSFYWKTHYNFEKKIKGTIPDMGISSKLLLMINALLPLKAFHDLQKGDPEALELWLDNLEKLPPENNSVTRRWESIGFRVPNAFYSQSFYYIYRNYCSEKKCLACKIGHLILGNRK